MILLRAGQNGRIVAWKTVKCTSGSQVRINLREDMAQARFLFASVKPSDIAAIRLSPLGPAGVPLVSITATEVVLAPTEQMFLVSRGRYRVDIRLKEQQIWRTVIAELNVSAKSVDVRL